MTSVTFSTIVGGDGSTVSDDKNPSTGLAGGGYIKRFIPALANIVAIANYIQSVATGLPNIGFVPVRLALTANDSLNGLAARDGVTPVAGNRILAPLQTTGSQNGIYIAAAGAWTRATDADTSAEFARGKAVIVMEGTANADTLWIHTTDGTVTLGTTALTFERLPSLSKINAYTGNNTHAGTETFNGNVLINSLLNMAGAINENKAAAVASSASPDVWSGAGNLVHITNTNAISGFSAAPRAGASRVLIFDGMVPITAGANLKINSGLTSYTTSANDIGILIADTTTSFILWILPANGQPVCPPQGLLDLSAATAGQIKFPATQNPSSNANTLDDYEEGTWTPYPTLGAAFDNAFGRYTKIGNTCYISGEFSFAAQTNSGFAEVGGIPFNGITTGNAQSNFFTIPVGITTEPTVDNLQLYGTTMTVVTKAGGNITLTTMSSDTVYFSGSYITS